jgi:hypothetical protein
MHEVARLIYSSPVSYELVFAERGAKVSHLRQAPPKVASLVASLTEGLDFSVLTPLAAVNDFAAGADRQRVFSNQPSKTA